MKIYLEEDSLKLDFEDNTYTFDVEDDYKQIVKLITRPTIKVSEFDIESIKGITGNKQVELIFEYIDRIAE
ncbi:hypothetical protein RZE82_02120 [Mollicutes bacterium LVI A0039]|nr:hypothetical protein RZE82_02120 [Mollicutes bacterium LVI A0039]